VTVNTTNPASGFLGDDTLVASVVATASVRHPQTFVAALSPYDPVSVSGAGDPTEQLFDVLLAVANEIVGEVGWTAHGESRSAVVVELAWWAMEQAFTLGTMLAFICALLLALPLLGLTGAGDRAASRPLARIRPMSGAGSTLSPPQALRNLIPVEARAA